MHLNVDNLISSFDSCSGSVDEWSKRQREEWDQKSTRKGGACVENSHTIDF